MKKQSVFTIKFIAYTGMMTAIVYVCTLIGIPFPTSTSTGSSAERAKCTPLPRRRRKRTNLDLRLKRARELLLTTDKSVSEIAYEVGFSAPAYFTRCYREAYHETPTDLREKTGAV